MENFKFWIFSICGASAITAIFKILLSDTTLKKSVNIFFSLFVLFYTVMPLQTMISDNKLDTINENGEISYNDYYEDGYALLIESSIKNTCAKISVEVLSVETDAYIDDEGFLNVNRIDVKTDSSQRNAEIKEYVKSQLGFEVNVS